MAAIYLRHPTHGTKVAISALEAENDIHNGWAYFDLVVPSAEVQEAEPETTNNLPRRRGRRPKESTE